MKKTKLFMMCLVALSMLFVGCKTDEPVVDADAIVEDGFYVVGEATGIADLNADGAAKATMSVGFNEVLQSAAATDAEKITSACQRAGMYEKYIVLEGGKPFSLVLKEGSVETQYGANLTLTDTLSGADEPAIRVYKGTMAANTTMQVTTSGLYHIVLDLNLNNDLSDKLILVAPVDWGVRGGMNSWGFTKMTATTTADSITYVAEDQELAAGGIFKFSYGGGWKIILDDAGLVKANTNIGAGMIPGAGNIAVEKAGKYKITLTFALAQGAIADSYKYKVELTEESALPTTMYMIGADFGNWSWGADGIGVFAPVNGIGGAFWCINYFQAANGFKFSPINIADDWSAAFTGLTTNTGYTISSDNCFVPSDGLYLVYIDVANNAVTIEPATVYGIGDAFGGYDEAVVANKFAASTDGKTLSLATTAAGNLRMYAGYSAIGSGNWWKQEFNVFSGKIEYRGNGGDQAAVAVTAGQTVTLDFKAGTGTIQ
ncbi:MAG: SusF/SusE family outer membrane protein [Paludibacter sp.]|nr:SusF/SusE family outer membrane protein [Paludibacter sp.]